MVVESYENIPYRPKSSLTSESANKEEDWLKSRSRCLRGGDDRISNGRGPQDAWEEDEKLKGKAVGCWGSPKTHVVEVALAIGLNVTQDPLRSNTRRGRY